MQTREALPRLKPHELRSWLLRGLRSRPTTELPTRRDILRILSQFDLSKEELEGVARELLAEVQKMCGRKAA